MKNAIIQAIEDRQKKTDIPDFQSGDTVKVSQRIFEGEGKKERIQIFEGVVLRRQGAGLNETMTVRKIVDSVGVEKTYPVHAITIAKIELVKYGKARRAKLYYLRDLVGSKVTRIKEDLQKNIEEAALKSKARKIAEKERDAVAQKAKEEAIASGVVVETKSNKQKKKEAAAAKAKGKRS